MKLVNLSKNSRAADSGPHCCSIWPYKKKVMSMSCHNGMMFPFQNMSLVCPASFAGWKSKGGKFPQISRCFVRRKLGVSSHQMDFLWLEVADQKDVTWCCQTPKLLSSFLKATTLNLGSTCLELGECIWNAGKPESSNFLQKIFAKS